MSSLSLHAKAARATAHLLLWALAWFHDGRFCFHFPSSSSVMGGDVLSGERELLAAKAFSGNARDVDLFGFLL